MLCLLAAAIAGSSMSYLDDGHIRLGVDLSKGGAITYLAKVGGPNLVNQFDLGREIQMSYYSGPVPFEPNGKKPNTAWAGLGWNPIQSGDCFGHPSVTKSFRNNGREIYLKCVPMQWPLDNEPGECTFESWISLDGDTVQVKNRIADHRADLTQYPGRDQELPAVYTNGPWNHLMTYTGAWPYTGDAATEIPKHAWGPSGPWTSFQATERWAAQLDDSGFGLGIWAPETQSISGGFAGVPGAGGPDDSPTGYIAPNLVEILDHNIVYDSRYVLIVGDLAAIRGYAIAHRPKQVLPDSIFRSDRRHWFYVDAQDAGWPIHGELRVRMEEPDPQLIGPKGCWQASEGSILTIVAAFKTKQTEAQVFWARLDAPGFSESRTATFKAIPDGRFHAYRIDLWRSPEYRGAITQLRFDPEPDGHPGDEVRVREIRISK